MTAKNCILYVDDERDLLDIGRVFLEDSGEFSVTTALSAPEAIRLLEQEKFDAIISDYQMPGMDGIQFLVEVRKRFGPIPFILFTGRGREEVVIQAINCGADFYLQKGGEPQSQFAELSQKINSAISRKKADDALRESEQKYRQLIEHSDEAIVVAQDGMLRLVNHRAVELTGYSEQELLSMPFPVLIHPDDRAMVLERYQKRLNGEELPTRYPFRLSPKDESIRWVEISAVVIDWHGRPATLNFFTDITGRKVAEEVLRENEASLRTTLGILPVGVFIFSKNGQILTANAMVNQIWGVTNGVVPHSSDMQEFVEYKGWWPDTGVALKPEEWAASRVLLNGETAPVDIVNIQRFNGSRGTIIVSAVPIHDTGGNVTGAVAVIQDITDRKRVEEALLFTRHSIDSATDTMVTVAKDGHFVDVNDSFCRQSGYTRDELLSMTVHDLDPDYNMEIWPAFWNKLKQSGTLTLETTHRTKEGSIYPVEITATYFEYNGNEYHCAFARDITGRKRAEEAQLKKAEELRAANEQLTASEEELRQNLDDLSRSGRALRESENSFRTIINSMQFGIVIIDSQTHTILKANPKALEMIGGTGKSVLGSVCHNFICPAESGRCPVTDLGQTVDSSERFLLTMSGEKIPILKSVVKTTLAGREVLIESFTGITGRETGEPGKRGTVRDDGTGREVPDEKRGRGLT